MLTTLKNVCMSFEVIPVEFESNFKEQSRLLKSRHLCACICSSVPFHVLWVIWCLNW